SLTAPSGTWPIICWLARPDGRAPMGVLESTACSLTPRKWILNLTITLIRGPSAFRTIEVGRSIVWRAPMSAQPSRFPYEPTPEWREGQQPAVVTVVSRADRIHWL